MDCSRIPVPLGLGSINQALIQQFQVAVIPGNTFGCQGCYLRVAYGALEPHTAQEGIERLVQGLQRLV